MESKPKRECEAEERKEATIEVIGEERFKEMDRMYADEQPIHAVDLSNILRKVQEKQRLRLMKEVMEVIEKIKRDGDGWGHDDWLGYAEFKSLMEKIFEEK